MSHRTTLGKGSLEIKEQVKKTLITQQKSVLKYLLWSDFEMFLDITGATIQAGHGMNLVPHVSPLPHSVHIISSSISFNI